jgi:hypothetical protein
MRHRYGFRGPPDMSSLADLPVVIGFFSYSRHDDTDFGTQLSSLREAIQNELRAQLGRTEDDLRVWQDQNAIAPGELWQTQITSAINQATFFIPIVTPRSVKSEHCKSEFDAFLAREQALGRNNLVFPIHYITVPSLVKETDARENPVFSIVRARQFVDWREYRQWPTDTPTYRKAIIDFCASISTALYEPWLSPQERRKQEEAAELQRLEEERRRQEAENRNRAEAEEERSRQRAEARNRAAEDARREAEDIELNPRVKRSEPQMLKSAQSQNANRPFLTVMRIAGRLVSAGGSGYFFWQFLGDKIVSLLGGTYGGLIGVTAFEILFNYFFGKEA